MFGGVALVHAKQIAGKKRRLVTAGAGADFQDDVAVVHRVLGDERKPQLLLERGAPGLELRTLRLGDGAHFRIGRGVGDQAREPLELALRRPIGLYRLDHGSKLGELARELHVGLGWAARQQDRVRASHGGRQAR